MKFQKKTIKYDLDRRGDGQGANYPRASSSKGPHSTECFKVWEASYSKQELLFQSKFIDLENFARFSRRGPHPCFALGPQNSLGVPEYVGVLV